MARRIKLFHVTLLGKFFLIFLITSHKFFERACVLTNFGTRCDVLSLTQWLLWLYKLSPLFIWRLGRSTNSSYQSPFYINLTSSDFSSFLKNKSPSTQLPSVFLYSKIIKVGRVMDQLDSRSLSHVIFQQIYRYTRATNIVGFAYNTVKC